MRAHQVILVVTLAFMVVFAVLTVWAMIRGGGPDILTVASLLVLGLLGTGVVGALREPPDE